MIFVEDDEVVCRGFLPAFALLLLSPEPVVIGAEEGGAVAFCRGFLTFALFDDAELKALRPRAGPTNKGRAERVVMFGPRP